MPLQEGQALRIDRRILGDSRRARAICSMLTDADAPSDPERRPDQDDSTSTMRPGRNDRAAPEQRRTRAARVAQSILRRDPRLHTDDGQLIIDPCAAGRCPRMGCAMWMLVRVSRSRRWRLASVWQREHAGGPGRRRTCRSRDGNRRTRRLVSACVARRGTSTRASSRPDRGIEAQNDPSSAADEVQGQRTSPRRRSRGIWRLSLPALVSDAGTTQPGRKRGAPMSTSRGSVRLDALWGGRHSERKPPHPDLPRWTIATIGLLVMILALAGALIVRVAARLHPAIDQQVQANARLLHALDAALWYAALGWWMVTGLGLVWAFVGSICLATPPRASAHGKLLDRCAAQAAGWTGRPDEHQSRITACVLGSSCSQLVRPPGYGTPHRLPRAGIVGQSRRTRPVGHLDSRSA